MPAAENRPDRETARRDAPEFRLSSEGELPLVTPFIRAAAVDPTGKLWISFVVPYTYVYDRDGDKIRAVEFHAAGPTAPNSLFFGPRGRILTTPGLFEFPYR